MRVLWFTNIPLDPVNRHFNRPTKSGGFWMHSLIGPLLKSGQVELAVVTASADPPYHFTDDGVEYFNIHQAKVPEVYQLFREMMQARHVREAGKIIERWKPDLIHVHGTERFFGLVRARGVTEAPTLVSIQGLISVYQFFAWGAMSAADVMANTTLWDLSHAATVPAIARRFRRQAAIEQEILKSADGVIGRTDWDRSHARAANPKVNYFHVDEMLRPAFLSAKPWSRAGATTGTLMTSSGQAPLKGLPVLLEAISILRRWGHDVKLKVAGVSASSKSGVARYLFKRIDALHLQDVVELLGWVDGDGLAARMQESHCYVTPSFIENSPNALSEAQLMGMPCVASHTGGIPTLVRDEETGLLFDRGDPAMLAHQVERVLLDDGLAQRLGGNAARRARRRHAPDTIVNDLLASYGSLWRPPERRETGADHQHSGIGT